MIPLVDIEDSKSKSDVLIGRKCFRCNSTTTFVDPKTGKATWRKRKIQIDDKSVWDGKNYYCDSCHHKLKRKWRNKGLEKDSRHGKGFRIEQVIAKTLGIKNCNVELDDFNTTFDLYDPVKYKDIQARSAKPSIRKASWKDQLYEYDVWHFGMDIPEFDTLMLVCMSEDYKDIVRIYAIPTDKLSFSQGITIYEDPKFPAWYEEFRIDEKPYNETYHSLSIEDCPVIKSNIKENK